MDSKEIKDIIAITLSKLFVVLKYPNYEDQNKSLMIWLKKERKEKISNLGFVKSLMYLLRINENMTYFIEDPQNIEKLIIALDESRDESQLCYYTIVCFWILSYSTLNLFLFEDRELGIIEKILKTIQLFRREKNVRIVMMIMTNLLKKVANALK